MLDALREAIPLGPNAAGRPGSGSSGGADPQITLRRDCNPMNDYVQRQQILYGGFPQTFLLGRGGPRLIVQHRAGDMEADELPLGQPERAIVEGYWEH